MSQARSRLVRSPQHAPHARLAAVVARHLAHDWRLPEPAHAAAAHAVMREALASGVPLVLDSGCGTGASTALLAQRHREALVVGVDKSAARLGARLGAGLSAHEGNALWLRTDVAALWRRLADDGVRLRRHYLLYPNPWPKPAHLRRRWHAHPAWPALLRLGGVLEMRCNWRVYAEEFVLALRAAGHAASLDVLAEDDEVLSPFERKYRASGHMRYRVCADLDVAAASARG